MWHLPVRTLFFTGRAAAQKLNQLGIYTIGDIAKSNPDFLKAHLNSQGVTLWNYANGRDNSPVKESPDAPKGYGNSTTLSKDLTSLSEAKPVLLELIFAGNPTRQSLITLQILLTTFIKSV